MMFPPMKIGYREKSDAGLAKCSETVPSCTVDKWQVAVLANIILSEVRQGIPFSHYRSEITSLTHNWCRHTYIITHVAMQPPLPVKGCSGDDRTKLVVA